MAIISAKTNMVYDRQYPAIRGAPPAGTRQALDGYLISGDGFFPKILYCFRISPEHNALNGMQINSVAAYVYFTENRSGTAVNTHVLNGEFTASDNGESVWAKCGANQHAAGVRGQYCNMRIESTDPAQVKNLLLYGLAISTPAFTYDPIKYPNPTIYTAAAGWGYGPYFEVDFSSPVLWAKDCVPAAGFVNEKQANTFNWAVDYDAARVLGTAAQKESRFQWRVKGESGYSELRGGAQPCITVPANTFIGSEIEWRVILISDNGTAGTPSAWLSLTTVDSLSAPLALYPKSLPIDGTRPITFTWRHDIPTGTAQTKYELQYSADNGANWLALASGNTDTPSYAAPANRFAAGAIMWRVRTSNSDGVAGNWSVPATFVVRAAPSAGIIGYDTKPRPTIRWQAAGQQGYRVKAGNYDSGILYGTMKSFQIPVYLPDGKTAVSLCVQNSFGMESPWSTAEIIVANKPSDEIRLATSAVPNGARLSWSTAGAYAKYYIYRDGKLIAKETGTTHTDWFANGKHTYRVRGVTAEDYYTISNEAVEFTRCKFAVIADETAPGEWLALKLRRGAPRTHDLTREQTIVYQYYSGRILPLGETNGYQSAIHTIAVTLRDRAEAERLENLLGHTVIYKDGYGDIAVGILGSCASARDNCVDVSLTIAETSRGVLAYDG